MFQKNSDVRLRLKIKRWIWVAYILFHSSKYQVYMDKFKQETREPKRRTRSPIKQYSEITKGLFSRLRNFGLRNRHFINEKHFIFIKIKRGSLSTMLYLVIGIKWFCEKTQINVGFYFPECDDFFENPLLASSEKKYREISGNFTHFRNTNLLICCARTMIPSEYGHKIISKLKVKEELQQQANVWIDNDLRGDWLAVHYRGTDARIANKYRVIRIESYIAYLKEVLDDHSSIFACSDQSQFIDQMHAAFPGRVFSRDIQRSDDTTPLHRKSEYIGNQQKQDALIDLLVLSRASLIYTTGSYFIDVLRFLNPAIKIISLDGRGKFYKNIPNYLPIPNLSALKRRKRKNSDVRLRLKIKRWIWVAYILFHSLKYTLCIYKFKKNTASDFVGENQSRIREYFAIIKKSFSHMRSFVLRNRHLINEKRLIFIKIKRRSLSTMLYLAIGIKWFCEKTQINVGFRFPKHNDFFENPLLASSEKKCREISRDFESFRVTLILICYARTMIPSEYGHKIISKLKVKEKLQQQANVWIDNNLRGDWLAVHYRGTDTDEYRFIEIENYIAYLKKVLDDHSSIFACSDQSQFIDQMHAAFPGRVFSRDIQRSDDKTPLHRKSEYKGNQQNRDALIDILVLSRASLIYTTGSYFIDVLRFLNPAIKIISLDGRGKFYKNIPNYLPIPNLSALKREGC